MINLRYHIVSITAVFLALGIGITMGSTFLGKATLDRIDSNVKNAHTEVNHVKDENAVLRKQLSLDQDRSSDLLREALGREFDGDLLNVPVVVIAADGVDQDTLNDLRTALQNSGASFDGTLTVTTKFELNGDDPAGLAKLMNLTTTSPSSVRRIVVSRVSAELLDAAVVPATPGSSDTGTTSTTVPASTTVTLSDPTTTAAGGTSTSVPAGVTPSTHPITTTTTTLPPKRVAPEVITKLIHSGYFDYAPASLGGADTATLLTQSGYRFVVVTGSTATIADADFVRPLLEDMTEKGPAPVVVASAAVGDDPESVRSASIGPLVKDPAIGDQVTTVDDLEQFSGIDAVILSLQDLAENRHGHYGVGDTAKSQLPTAHG